VLNRRSTKRRRSRASAWPAVLAATALTALARDAFASPTSRLVYVRGPGAESCPDEASIRSAVAARLGYDPFRPLAPTTLTAEVRREKSVYRARVRLVDDAGVERGARDLESRADDCGELTTAMALSMSIAIDPLSLTRPVEPTPTDVPDPAPSPSLPPALPPALPLPPPRDPLRFGIGAAAHAAFGIAPAPALGLRLSAELATRRFSVAVEGRFDLPSSSETPEGGRARTSLAGAALIPCIRVPLARACAVALVARVGAEAVDVSAPRSDGFLFLGAGGRLVSAIELPQDFELRIGGDLLAHPMPFELTVNGRSVHRSSTVSALAGVGVSHIF
jgi:hypothetical protein